MAFFSKVGNILKQSVSKQITSQISASNPAIYQALRCMSSSKLFIGGLPYAVDDTSLRDTFSQYGEVVEARVIIDRESNRSRGFGFVTFSSTEEASSAIQALDGQDFHGRTVKVNYAADRAPRQFGGGGYGGGGYGGGGYGGGVGYGGGGGYGGGQNYGGGNSGGYGGGSPSGGQYGGDGGGDGGGASFGGGSGGGSYGGGSAETGFSSSGFDQGTGLGLDNAGGSDPSPSEPMEGNFRDDNEGGDFAKRA